MAPGHPSPCAEACSPRLNQQRKVRPEQRQLLRIRVTKSTIREPPNPGGSLEANLPRACKETRAAVRRSSSFKLWPLIGHAVLVVEAPAATGALGLEIVARVADRIAFLPITDL